MMTENLAALIRYRMDQAEEALDAARILFREGSFRASINRSYYAMFYMVLALLASRKEETSKHSGAIALFDRLFVHPGRCFPIILARGPNRASWELDGAGPRGASRLLRGQIRHILSRPRYAQANRSRHP